MPDELPHPSPESNSDDSMASMPLSITPPFDDFPIDEDSDEADAADQAAPLENLTAQVHGMAEQLSLILADLGQLKADERILDELHERNRQLIEQFHEREVLSPIFLGLIGIADRHRHQYLHLRQLLGLRKYQGRSAQAALRHLMESHKADRLEIENLLAILAVEPFEHPDRTFSCSVQSPIERIDTDRADIHHHIARRLLPGYRRGQRIIRQELVSVYVNHHPRQTPATHKEIDHDHRD